ncbi:MAG: sensor histidine kinase [Chloroflexota bacterium]
MTTTMADRLLDTPLIFRRAMLISVLYLVCLGGIEIITLDQKWVPFVFYAVQTGLITILFVASLFPWSDQTFRNRFLPLALLFVIIFPTLAVHVMLRFYPEHPRLEASDVTVRLYPIFLLSLLFVARVYGAREVIFFTVGVLLTNLFGRFLPVPEILMAVGADGNPIPPSRPMIPGSVLPRGTITLFIQTFTFLVIGLLTNMFVVVLRAQKEALEVNNAQLRLSTIAQTELTISQERNRMARELHDTVAHSLTGLNLQLQTVKAYWDIDSQQAKSMLDQSLDTAGEGLVATRRALNALRAEPLEDLGLKLALHDLAQSVAERTGIDIELKMPDMVPIITPEINQTVYRIAQEAISNIEFHANATVMWLEMEAVAASLRLKVADNGIGFDPNQEFTGHWGLLGMRERAKLVNGRLNIDSQPHKGTQIYLSVPLGL